MPVDGKDIASYPQVCNINFFVAVIDAWLQDINMPACINILAVSLQQKLNLGPMQLVKRACNCGTIC